MRFQPAYEVKDAGRDAALACGTQMCGRNQVCCMTKTPPFANCIDPKDFVADNCEMFQLQQPPCIVPQDCDAGAVCCFQFESLLFFMPEAGRVPG